MYKRIHRRDGSVVVLVPRADAQSVTWEIMFKVGSRQETAHSSGVSHFIEHMMFKGTKKRPSTKIISRELDAVGAHYNAFTSKDHTGYYVQSDAKHLNLGIDILSDMLRHSLFDPQEMNRERNIILEEISIYQDNPMLRIDEVFEKCIFGATPLARDILGPRTVIQTLPQSALVQYKRRYYYPGNMVIGLAGKFDEKRAVQMIDKYFPVGLKKARARIQSAKITNAKPHIALEYKDTNQIQCMIGFPGFKRKHPDADALTLFSVIMGGTMSSRLFISIRERQGLAYDIRAGSEAYEDVGYFAIRGGFDKEKVFKAITAIKKELDRVAQRGITKDELRRAKDNIRGRMVLHFENPSSYLSFLATQELLTSTIKSLEERLDGLERVTVDHVNRAARSVIRWSRAHLALIGPYKDEKRFLDVLT